MNAGMMAGRGDVENSVDVDPTMTVKGRATCSVVSDSL